MNNINQPNNTIFWQIPITPNPACNSNTETEIAIVGGGIAGLFAAYQAVQLGKKVTLFEKYYCGSGATGKSSGFITPNAELSFTDFTQRFGDQKAKEIWDLINSGVLNIKNLIEKQQFTCDFKKQDTLLLASYKKDIKKIEQEHKALTKAGYQTILFNQTNIKNEIRSNSFFGGLLYENTFAINAFQFCQEMKKFLEKQGVVIFEETPIVTIEEKRLTTSAGHSISFDKAVICIDRFLPDLQKLQDDVSTVQTFIMVSSPLTPEQIQHIFPDKAYMAWDSQLIYNYFRLTGDNRLLLGGGDLFSTYRSEIPHYHRIVTKLKKYLDQTFPDNKVDFEYMWPGLLGISKDIGPMAGRDKNYKNIYYVTAATGLPIAAALGTYSIQHLLENRYDLDTQFNPYRSYPIGGFAQKIIGKKLAFALCNVIKQNIP